MTNDILSVGKAVEAIGKLADGCRLRADVLALIEIAYALADAGSGDIVSGDTKAAA